MTLPFKNSNNGIVKKLARRSLSADRRRNLFIGLTIFLSVCLMSLMAFYFSASQMKSLQNIKDQYQAGCANMTKAEIDRLASYGNFEEYGYETASETAKYADSNLMITFLDEGMRSLSRLEKISGSYPVNADEIVVERAFLDYFGLSESIGDRLTLDLGEGEQSWLISGILERENSARMFYVMVSEAYIEETKPGGAPFSLKFRLKEAPDLEPDALKAEITAFLTEAGVSEDDIFFSSNYFDMTELYLGSDMQVYIAALFIAVACSIVIYNIFYISVIGKMREYGRLKVIGATPAQLSGVVKRERRALALISIPSGLIAGAVFVVLLMPGCWNWTDNLKYAVIIVLLTEAVLLFSTRKPIRLAGQVSAIEAVRATAYSMQQSAGRRKASHRPRRKLSLPGLALMNFSRNKKKAALTLASLGFTGILLICIAAYGSSVDPLEMGRANLGDGGDYYISWTNSTPTDEYDRLQRKNPLSEALTQQLQAIPEVQTVSSYKLCSVRMPEIHEEDAFTITGLTREQFAQLLPTEAFLEGSADYDTLLNGDGILYMDTPENLMKMLYHTELHAGDKVKLITYDGIEKEMTIRGVVSSVKTGLGGFFILPEEVLPTLYPDITNFTACLNLHISEDSQQLRETVYEIVKDPQLMITSVQDYADSIKPSLRLYMNILYGLLAFIFLFSLLNLVNTLITNLIARQQEFGIFQSVGMSSGQLSRMLSYECAIYIGSTIFITLTLGTICSLIVCSLFSQIGIFGELTYRFPLWQVIIFTVILLVTLGIFSLAAARYCRQRPLVERINTQY